MEKVFRGQTISLNIYICLLTGPICSAKANVLEVILGDDNSVQNGSVFRFVKGNGVKELKAEKDFAPEATGSVTVLIRQRDRLKRPEFSLTGPTEICPDTSATVLLSNMKGFGRGKTEIQWTITNNNGDTLEDFGSTEANARKLKIESAKLKNGITYKVSVSAKNLITSKTTSKNITMTKVSDKALSVQISGPSIIRSDQILRLKARSRVCGGETTASSTFSVNSF